MSDELQRHLQAALGDAYVLGRELGGGGMSRVFVARETALDRDVVVKVLAPELTAGVSAERFAREIATAARLQQANIVPVLTAGVAGDVPYYTMPFVRGESLRARVTQGVALSLGDRLGVLRDVARALAFAHAEGVVHRDIKPDNVLLSGGTAVVTDFGIAKAITAARTHDGTAAAADAGTLTQLGTTVGTPAYMAPEQAVGDEVDARADVYAWGVMAYELLAGVHPFAGKTSAAALIAAHLAEPPQPLSARSPELPAGVAALVMQCLAKAPGDRPGSADVILAQLAEMGVSSGAQPVPTARDAAAPGSAVAPSRWRPLALPLGLVLVASALYLWMARTSGAPTASMRTVVVVPFDNLGDSSDAYFAEGVSEEIGSQLARLPGVQVIGRAGVQRFRGSGRLPQDIGRELGAAWVLSGSVRWARAGGARAVNDSAQVRIVPALINVKTGQQEWGQAFSEPLTDVFEVQAAVAERVASALSVRLGAAETSALRRRDSTDPETRDAQMLGRHFLRQRGLVNLRRAVSEFRRAIARDSSFARAWAGYSEAMVLLPSYFDTIDASRAVADAQRAAERAVALDSLLPEAHVALARARWTDFRFGAALRAIDRAILLDPSSSLAHQQRFETLMAMGRVDEGARAIAQALALDGLVPLLHFERSILFFARNQMDSALAAVDRAIALDQEQSAYWHGQRWGMLAQQGRRDEAIGACVRFSGDALRCRALTPSPSMSAAETVAMRAMLANIARDPATVPWLPPTVQALLHTWIGDRESAFARLRAAVDTHDPNVLSLQYAPGFSTLHDDPRWTALVRDLHSR